MGYATSKKVSKKVGNEVEIRTKIAASFLAPLHPIPRLRSVKRFQAELKKTQIGLPRRCSACGWGDSLKMEALNPSLETSESELVQKAGAGCREAFYQLVQPCERVLFASAMAILNNEADAEEAAQEAVLKAFTNISRFRGECKFSTWIIQICINEARAKIHKARKYLYESIDEPENGEDGDYFPRDFADWREIPSEALQRKELREALQRAMASLPEKYREVLILRDIQHLSIEETAQVLGIGKGNVKTRLLRARLQMRDALAPGIDGNWTLGRPEYAKVRAW